MNKSTIHLTRISQYADSLRQYKVFVDGEMVGKIKKDETLKISLKPGKHEIKLKIDWCSSNTLLVNVQENENIHLECGNNLGGFPLMIIKQFLAITIMWNTYLYVKKR